MRRQEKLSEPDEEQDPQRLVVSRKVILPGATPSFLVWLSTAALRSREASLIRKSRTRRGTKGAPALTQSKGVLPRLGPPSSTQTPRRAARQRGIWCNVPRNGTNPPGWSGIFSGSWRNFASLRRPRAGMVKTTSCAAARTRKVKRRAEAFRRKLIR